MLLLDRRLSKWQLVHFQYCFHTKHKLIFNKIKSSISHGFGITNTGLQQDTVAIQELVKCVADGIASFPYADGLHHAGVTKLTNAQLPVKKLKQKDGTVQTKIPSVLGI